MARSAGGNWPAVRTRRSARANQKQNYTRFLVVAREPVTYGLGTPCETSLMFATKVHAARPPQH